MQACVYACLYVTLGERDGGGERRKRKTDSDLGVKREREGRCGGERRGVKKVSRGRW